MVAGQKKEPTTVASRGFLSKLFLTSTRASGVAGYDDYQSYLSDVSKHFEDKIMGRLHRGQVLI